MSFDLKPNQEKYNFISAYYKLTILTENNVQFLIMKKARKRLFPTFVQTLVLNMTFFFTVSHNRMKHACFALKSCGKSIIFSHVFLMRPKSVKIAYWVSLTWWPLTCDWWSVTTLAVLKSGKVGLITNEQQNSAQFWPQVNGNFRWQPQSIIDIVVFVKTITIATSVLHPLKHKSVDWHFAQASTN